MLFHHIGQAGQDIHTYQDIETFQIVLLDYRIVIDVDNVRAFQAIHDFNFINSFFFSSLIIRVRRGAFFFRQRFYVIEGHIDNLKRLSGGKVGSGVCLYTFIYGTVGSFSQPFLQMDSRPGRCY